MGKKSCRFTSVLWHDFIHGATVLIVVPVDAADSCSAVDVSRGIENHASRGLGSICERAGKVIECRLLPAAAGWSELKNRSAALVTELARRIAAAVRRAIEIARFVKGERGFWICSGRRRGKS
jgi:hypothetical protein